MADGPSRVQRTPRSPHDIADSAAAFVYDPMVPFKNWLRSARQLRQQADIYEEEGDLERAYELYFRQVILVLEKLQQHPEAKLQRNRALLHAAQKDAQISLSRAEALKPYIKKTWEDWEKRRLQNEESRRKSILGSRPTSSGSGPGSGVAARAYGNGRLSGEFSGHRWEEFEGRHHQDMALEVARRGQRSNGYTRVSRPVNNEIAAEDGTGLSRQMQGLRMRMDAPSSSPRWTPSSSSRTSSTWNYPSVPESKPTVSGSQKELWLAGLGNESYAQPAAHPDQLSIRPPSVAPARPGKEPLSNGAVPARPPKETATSSPPNTLVASSAPMLPPKSPSTVPETRMFKPAAFLENGTPLRTVFLPPGMRRDFLRLAQQNTLRNLETCGIICGTLKSNALFVSLLVIPEQTATSDTCEMTDDGEIALFDFCESNDLLTLGWIHTHPTQTCFMSSRDLHTHHGYQAMMPESIAIVCAPSQGTRSDGGEWGAFRLTDPPGIQTIRTCENRSLFHPHEGGNIYTEATRPGHVVLLEGLAHDVHDMRK